MLDTIGASTLEDLYSHLPEDVCFHGALNIPAGKSEYEIVDYFRARGLENANSHANFLGAGGYHHYRVAQIWPAWKARLLSVSSQASPPSSQLSL